MSAEGWAAVLLVGFVLLFLGGLFYLVRTYMQGQAREEGGRRYDELEKTDWFQDPRRLERMRDSIRDSREERPPPAPERPAEELYGERVRGGDDA